MYAIHCRHRMHFTCFVWVQDGTTTITTTGNNDDDEKTTNTVRSKWLHSEPMQNCMVDGVQSTNWRMNREEAISAQNTRTIT